MIKAKIVFFFLLVFVFAAGAQDTLLIRNLQGATVTSYRPQAMPVQRLADVHGTFIVAGKKNEVISVTDLSANLAEKTGRQLFARVPGAFVYDMDGAGNQLNVSTRGLDPHRSWEYNVRQNGVMTNSDIYGYPASHYSAPMEAIQRIEIIRGTGSLQYGAQFGGMINYITKEPDTSRVIGYEGVHTAGSFGLLASYHAIGGKKGPWRYYAYYQRRSSNGYREGARSESEGQFAAITYQPSATFSAKAELGRSTYLYRIPGPLTDSMFMADPRQATRTRNYFNPDIYVPSLEINWQPAPNTRLRLLSSAVLGERNSIQFVGFANVPDAIDPTTGLYQNRQVDIDRFNSYTTELRLTQTYHLGRVNNVLAAGVQYIKNNLHRRQLGKGSTGSDFDLRIEGDWGRNLRYRTSNIAFFVENLIQVNKRLSFTPGIRIEQGATDMTGSIAYREPETLPNTIAHRFPLLGLQGQYRIDGQNRIYGGFSQAYRPVIFADLIPATALERTDENLKDARGYNIEAGVSGRIKSWLAYDLSYFLLQYDNRIGTQALTDNGESYIFKTNVGASRTQGVEFYAEATALDNGVSRLSVFTATAYMDAAYLKGSLIVNGSNTDISGNRVESVPEWTSRNGVQYQYKNMGVSVQYSYVGESFADPLNTVAPSANGARGLVPDYQLWDVFLTWRATAGLTLKLGANNLTDEQYFTKRPTGYPGAGVWSSDGRSIIGTVVVRL